MKEMDEKKKIGRQRRGSQEISQAAAQDRKSHIRLSSL